MSQGVASDVMVIDREDDPQPGSTTDRTVSLPDVRRSTAPSPLDLLVAADARDEACALVTVLGIAGGAPRRRGAQMAVTASGEVCGSLSGGCLDAAVIAEAHAAWRSRISHRIRFGVDSPYMDLVLPCGSGLDLQFDGAIGADTIRAIATALQRRERLRLVWDAQSAPPRVVDAEQDSAQAESIVVPPRLRLLLAGASENLRALATLAQAAGIDTIACSTDAALLRDLAGAGCAGRLLANEADWQDVRFDACTAALTVFHEHEAEYRFLQSALASDAFLVGAMGSVRAQALRVAALRERGVPESALVRLRGPFGLIDRARDPHELAISMLAELMLVWRDHAYPDTPA